jgi:WD40 repeat protein
MRVIPSLSCLALAAVTCAQIPTSGLKLWLKADAGVQLSGQNVTQWDDASGNGIHALRGSANGAPASNPRLVAGAFNGKPVLRFDGSDTWFSFPRITDMRTIFWAVSKDAASFTSNVEHERCVFGDEGFGLLYNADFLPNTTTGTGLLHRNTSSIYLREGQTRLNGKLGFGPSMEYPKSLGVVSFVSTGNVAANHLSYDRGYPGRGWWGDLAEAIVYDRVLPESERAAVEKYLLDKYGLAGQSEAAPPSEAWAAAAAAGAAPGRPADESRPLCIAALAMSPDGKTLASAGDVMRLWDVADGHLIRTAKEHPAPEVHAPVAAQPGQFTRMVFSPDGKTLAACGTDRLVYLWNALDGSAFPVKGAMAKPDAALWGIAFSPDGKSLVSNFRNGANDAIKYDLASGAAVKYLSAPPGGWDARLWGLAFSPDGKWVAASNENQAVNVWDAATGNAAVTLSPHSMVFGFAFSPDGKTLAAACVNMTLQLWDLPAGKLRQTLYGHGGALMAVAYSADGRRLATGGDDGTARLWDAQTGALLRTLAGHAGGVWSVAFTPDGNTLFTGGGDLLVKRWDVATGELRQTLQSGDGVFRQGSPGRYLGAGSPSSGNFSDALGRAAEACPPHRILFPSAF